MQDNGAIVQRYIPTTDHWRARAKVAQPTGRETNTQRTPYNENTEREGNILFSHPSVESDLQAFEGQL